MTIEFHKPELKTLIMERIGSGAFENVEDVLMQALTSSQAGAKENTATGAGLVAAMQASPYREIDLLPTRSPMPVRYAAF